MVWKELMGRYFRITGEVGAGGGEGVKELLREGGWG